MKKLYLNDLFLRGMYILDNIDVGEDVIVNKSVSGTPVIFSRRRYFKDITIMGGENSGVLSLLDWEILQGYAENQNALTLLVISEDNEEEEFIVRFKKEDLPFISGEKITPIIKDGLTFYKNIVIKLMDISNVIL
jgi:hypothetical protein